ncbi:MAG: hypothetical protein NTW16_08625 [Bacteroidetes bacterium]|nr:hypothetical protein [Bacteroidota bacterium]
MTSFLSIEAYSPILVFFLGFLTYFGFAGTGLALFRLFNIRFPLPWRWIAALLLGIQAGSLMVQVAGMAGMASHRVLVSVWLFMLIAGIMSLVSDRDLRKNIRFRMPRGLSLIIAIPVLIAILINLLAAVAPSTKIDELYYHMLLPSRIVNDQGLVFYRYPIESAALPQMIYQISLTPLHSLGFPDAGNVVSLGLNLTFMVFGWQLIKRQSGSATWAWLWIAPLCIGMYPVIWQVTGGAFAMGDLATAAAVLAMFLRADLMKKLPAPHYYLLISVFILGSVSSKITLLPLGFLILLISGLLIFRDTFLKKERIKILWFISIPWLIFYLPVILYTWQASGSPFGPFLAGIWGTPSAYAPDEAHRQLQYMKEVNIPTFRGAMKATLMDYSPLLWIGVLLIFSGKTISSGQKRMILLLLGLQIVVVLGFLYADMRFFGGLVQGIVLLFAITASVTVRKKLAGSYQKILAITLVLLIPWLTVQIYYSTIFWGVVTGIQPKTEFYRTKTSFYEDYRRLHQIMPKDAVFLLNGPLRFNAVYAPRPVYFSEADIPAGKQVFLMIIEGNLNPGDSFGSYTIGNLCYENRQAIAEVFRTPGIPPKVRPLKVFSLFHFKHHRI